MALRMQFIRNATCGVRAQAQDTCFSKCAADTRCQFATVAKGWCFNAQYCNSTGAYSGNQKGSSAYVHTYARPPAPQLRSHVPEKAPSAANALAGVRELASLSSPWFFSAVPKDNASFYEKSWDTAFDPQGLAGPYGLRSAEKRHPKYFCGGGCCSWSGPMWPFESSKAVTAAINVLNDYPSVTSLNNAKLWTLL